MPSTPRGRRVRTAEVDTPIGVRLPAAPAARLVFAGDVTLERMERRVRPASGGGGLTVSSAEHSRIGDVAALLPDSVAALQPLGGDSVTVRYAADTLGTAAAAGHFFVVGPPARGAAPARARLDSSLPRRFALYPSRPNPFSRTTTLRFDLPRRERVALEVWDLQGRRVARLLDGALPAGAHAVEWDRRTTGGGAASPGVYLYRLEAGEFRAVRKMVLVP